MGNWREGALLMGQGIEVGEFGGDDFSFIHGEFKAPVGNELGM